MVENVLLITIDSLRADRFPLDRQPEGGSETFRAFASVGVTFENAFATGPGTTSSFPALLTGTLPLSFDGLGPLSPDRPKLAERLREADLETAGFQTNPFLSAHFNYDAGFDVFEDYQNPLMGIATSLFPRGIEINNPKLRRIDETLNLTGLLKRAYRAVSGKARPYVAADVITDDVIDWLETTDDPFFCWAHYMDVHHPCHPPAEIRRRFGVEDVTAAQVSEWYSTALDSPDDLDEDERATFERLYDAAIAYTDQQIARIVAALRSSGRWDDTMVVVTSDHGELFGEYGSYGKPVRAYDELLRVPLVVLNGPGSLRESRENLVSLLDVPPLIHDALGVAIPDAYEGRVPDPDADREFVLAEHQIESGVVVGSRDRELLYEYDGPDDERGLYAVGPTTFEPVGGADGRGELLRTTVEERLDAVDASTEPVELDDEVEQRLSDLGYR